MKLTLRAISPKILLSKRLFFLFLFWFFHSQDRMEQVSLLRYSRTRACAWLSTATRDTYVKISGRGANTSGDIKGPVRGNYCFSMPVRERNREHGGACTIGAAVLTLSLVISKKAHFLLEKETGATRGTERVREMRERDGATPGHSAGTPLIKRTPFGPRPIPRIPRFYAPQGRRDDSIIGSQGRRRWLGVIVRRHCKNLLFRCRSPDDGDTDCIKRQAWSGVSIWDVIKIRSDFFPAAGCSLLKCCHMSSQATDYNMHATFLMTKTYNIIKLKLLRLIW